MKRQIPDNDSVRGACSAKRRKSQSSDVGATPMSSHPQKPPPPPKAPSPPKSSSPPTSPPPPNPPSQTLLLGEDLRSTQQSTWDARKLSIQNWIEGSTSPNNTQMMAAPPTPRSAYGSDRGRLSRRHARSSGSRTPSPSKKPSPQTYRTRNMYNVSVYVDNQFGFPSAIGDVVRQILGIESVEDRVVATADEPHSHLTRLAATYCAKSQRNARECLLEGDWKASLNSLVEGLADLSPDILRTHTSEKSTYASHAHELRMQDAYFVG
jgi:hypothetical protein